jgi:hypothetical protein
MLRVPLALIITVLDGKHEDEDRKEKTEKEMQNRK